MIKYKANLGGSFMPEARILRVDVVKQTDKTVWLTNGMRERKETDYHNYFDTWEEAHAAMVEKAERIVRNTRQRLEHQKGMLGNIKGMKKPEEAK